MSAYNALAPHYDELTGDVHYERFADFYELVFKKYGVAPELILDLACGTGTLTGIMAGRGYEMIGVDGSEEMLAEAAEKLSAGGFHTPPMLLCQSMEELDLYGTVSAAYCSLDGINYIPPESLPEVFHRLHLFVEPGGIVIFDINTPKKLAALDGQVFLDETEDVYCVWRSEFDRELGALVYGMDVFSREQGGLWSRGEEEHIEYAHNIKLLEDILKAQGFDEISVFGELEMRAPRPDEERVFIAARRI